MFKWRKNLRFLAALQLVPALESGEETLVGGQAVLEGVMMRSPHAWGIAVRKPSGEVATHSEPLDRPSEKHKWMGWPVLRGVVTMGHAMKLGFRALKFSANVALDEAQPDTKPEEKLQLSGWLMALNIVISLGFFIFMYKFLPLLAATELKNLNPIFDSQIAFNVVDGIIRILLFLLFIWSTSLWKDLRRVYEYHGAEHKTVFAFESGDQLTIPNAQKFSTFHPRCGTSFLMTVMLISIVVYTLVPVHTFWSRFAIRIVLLPVIAGLSYEIIRFAAKARAKALNSGKSVGFGSMLFTALTAPGLWLQRITTQPPADDQVECAIVALNASMEIEKQRGGEMVLA
ncbi:MAG TPA: DUF1385 domain-containing protein [Terriglobales bacterium]|nr:DUF1385 domain-containing protein [Terriglobales bacterium]